MSHDDEPSARRRFLAQGAAAAASLLAGGQARSDEVAPPGIPDWMRTPGADVGSQTYGLPSRFEAGVIRNVPKGLPQYISASSRAPLQAAGLAGNSLKCHGPAGICPIRGQRLVTPDLSGR